MRQPIFIFYTALILAVLFAGWRWRQDGPPPVPPQEVTRRPQPDPPKPALKNVQTLEMVFALDTTGSMTGLIDGAKRKIWGIVNGVLQKQCARKVRVGLVAYRDRGDDYVTKLVPLTDDLDEVYSQLMDFQANGGGDTPEDVRRALTVAVRNAGWSRRSREVAQILFLVGDAPPHDEYQDEPRTAEITTEAAQRGILIDTIQCGDAPDTRQQWQMIASRGQGEYFAIAQDGGVQVADTPYDRELAELGRRMGDTYVPYGASGRGAAGEARMMAQSEIEAHFAIAAAPSAQADRALNKAINADAYRDDIVSKIANGHAKLSDVRTESLPASLAALPPVEQSKAIQRRVDERNALSARIVELTHKRESYLASRTAVAPAMKSSPAMAASRAPAAFDTAVASAVAAQTAPGRRGGR